MNYQDDEYFGEEAVNDSGDFDEEGGAVIDDEPLDAADVIPINQDMQTGIPTIDRAEGLAEDFSSLLKNASTGDIQAILSGLESFSQSQLSRFFSFTTVGPLLLFWAYKGRLSVIERSLMALIGAGSLVYSFRQFQKNSKLLNSEQAQKIISVLKENFS